MNTISKSYPVNHLRTIAWLLAAGLCFWSALGQAQNADPASRVARVSYLKGQVYTQTIDDDRWSNAAINQPLTTGDQLWTDNRARAELQMGSTTLQIDADTQLELLELSDDVLQLQVTQGVVNVRVRNLSRRDTVEIDTPDAAISVMESGTYRVEVAANDALTVVQVRDGSANVAGEQQDFTLRDDEQLTLRSGQRDSAKFDRLARMDEFDRWAAERNQRAERVAASRYVGADVIGYEDLDDYGYWRWYNDYGYVWMPTRIVSGWAPYRYGHWTWISPWGWTWIDDAPWGFAPSHYGRWTTISNRWCWVPGPRTVRAVYAPALVAWIGTPGLSVSVNIGAQPVGWIPLGPREVYRPVYRSSHNYVVNVNLSNSLLNNSEFERDYRRQPHEVNYGNRGAASVVNADALRNARPINNQLIRSGDRQLQPVATLPITRLERRDQDTQRATPPMPANTRGVLARRQPIQPVTATTNSGDARPGKQVGVRVIEPTVTRRSSDTNGAGPTISNGRNRSGVSTDERDIQRGANRSSNNETNTAPANRNTRSITTTPSVRPDIRTAPRGDQPRERVNTPIAAPATPNATPMTSPPRETTIPSEPQVRSNTRRDEARPSAREENRGNDSGAAAQRERSVTVPNNPAPAQRSDPSQAAPASAPVPSNSNSERARDNQEDRRRRGFKVEEQ